MTVRSTHDPQTAADARHSVLGLWPSGTSLEGKQPPWKVLSEKEQEKVQVLGLDCPQCPLVVS